MTTNEQKVLSIIWDWGGEASVDIIAREAGISTNYARLLCESLGREGCIDFLHSKLCKIKSKGKIAVASKRGQNLYPVKSPEGGAAKPQFNRARKIVIPEKPSRWGLGKDKKGRIILNYG